MYSKGIITFRGEGGAKAPKILPNLPATDRQTVETVRLFVLLV